MKKILLGGRTTKKLYALVDDNDFEELSKFRWCIQRKKYPARMVGKKLIYMHRFINKTPNGMITDHIDGNTLNNTKNNLRTCSQSENLMNTVPRKNTTSKFKGVFLNSRSKKWEAQIHFNGKKIYLGRFINELDAAKKYNQKAIILYKEFAKINNI